VATTLGRAGCLRFNVVDYRDSMHARLDVNTRINFVVALLRLTEQDNQRATGADQLAHGTPYVTSLPCLFAE